MANWIRKINLQPEWSEAKEGKITIHQMADVVSQKLNAIEPIHDLTLELQRSELVDAFGWIASDPETDADDFDNWMNELYDWGDTALDANWNGRKVCWIGVI